jgi:hypothetical protein
MIEKIRIDTVDEEYLLDVGAGQVVVVMCLDGTVNIPNIAILNKYETWTTSNSPQNYGSNRYTIKSGSNDGCEFLIVRYYR